MRLIVVLANVFSFYQIIVNPILQGAVRAFNFGIVSIRPSFIVLIEKLISA